jgi:hypothetical protein
MKLPQIYNDKPLIHAWNYCAKDGVPFGVVGRYQDGSGKKEIVPFFKRNGSNWIAGIEVSPRLLYGLDKLAAHPRDKAVFVVEGEKSAEAMRNLGIVAVSSLGGAQAAKQADWTPLDGYQMVYLLPDNDKSGEQYMKDVYGALITLETPPHVKVIRLSNLPDKGDIVDWIKSCGGFKWDEYESIPAIMHERLKERLRTELRKAESVPEGWALVGSVSVEYSDFDWDKPGDIKTDTPRVQPLQDNLIPESFKTWLADVSLRMQTPGDFAAVSSIVIAGSLIGAGCSIKPKRLDDWEVIPNVWGACIGRPSVVLKTPSMKEPMQLLERLQAEYGEQFEQEKAVAGFNSLTNKAMIDELKVQLSKVAKGKKEGVVNRDELQKLKADYIELSESAEPEATRRLFKTNETSIQSMTLLQTQNERGILVFRDELMGLLVKWDREDCADERAYFLEGWNGNGSYTDVKIGRGLTDAKSICISLLGGIQPDKLKRYLYQAQQGNNDGLIQRLQLAVWPDEPECWQLIDTKPNKTEKQRAFDIMKALAELDFKQYGAIQSEYDERPYFRFDDAGQEVFNQWLTELQTVRIKREDNPLMVEHFGKFRSLMPALALIFHCIDIADGKAQGSISVKAARLAVNWCCYLESHARRIYAMALSPVHEAAVRLADKIKAGLLPSPFTTRDIERKGWHGLNDRQEAEAACYILMQENWLRIQKKPKPVTGRPPLPEYLINPVFL